MFKKRHSYYKEHNYYENSSFLYTDIFGIPIWVIMLVISSFILLVIYLMIANYYSANKYFERIEKNEHLEKVEYICLHYPKIFKNGVCDKIFEMKNKE